MVLEKLEKIEKRYIELEHKLADTDMMQNKAEYQKLAKELSDITPLVQDYRELKRIEKQAQEMQHLLDDANTDSEFKELASTELAHLTEKKESIIREIKGLWLQERRGPQRDVIVEIRTGTGGEEAAIFVGDLYKMYIRYAAKRKWKVDILALSPTELGGFKEVIFSVSGKDASHCLKYESGVHRVQRVPQTEASGRIHTSAATVAILVEPEEIELTIDPKDLKIDVYRASGAGGQHVNRTESAVRLTHLPTGMVVTCQDERSQMKNRAKAMRVLRARILDQMNINKTNAQSEIRKKQIGSGDRSEKIRTYNYPDRRITDHRIGLTVYNLEQVLEGDLDEIVNGLLKAEEQDSISEN